MHIIVDGFGGDEPQEITKGVVDSLCADKDIKVTLTGDKAILQSFLTKIGATATALVGNGRLTLLHAPDVISNNDAPAIAIKNKKESSLVKAIDLLNSSSEYVGLISAGSTGAVLAGGVFKVGRLDGVRRPTLISAMPTSQGDKIVLLSDTGANMDCTPDFLIQFAHIASIYSMAAFKTQNPKIALLNVGPEEKKGNELIQKTHKLLLEEKALNFVGNMEARDALSGDFDVILTDGFGGNVLLKGIEGTAKMIFSELKGVFKHNIFTKFGTLFLLKRLKKLLRRMDYHKMGGAPFLGINKLVIKAHGSSKSTSIEACIKQIKTMHSENLIQKIAERISTLQDTEKL